MLKVVLGADIALVRIVDMMLAIVLDCVVSV